MSAVWDVRDLHETFRRTLNGVTTTVRALDGVNLVIDPHQRIGIVGESGSGKSTLVRILDGLQRPTSGSVLFHGQEIIGAKESELTRLRSEVQMIFQDPRSSLDPRMTAADIITEPLRSPALKMPKEERDHRLYEVLQQVGLDASDAKKYPHEFSGGQRQRLAIARAFAPHPLVLIADEAVSALDVSVRTHVLNVLMERVESNNLTLVFVSHDLSVIRHVCDSVIVMKSGRIVEQGSVESIYSDPQEAYTKELLAAIPRIRHS